LRRLGEQMESEVCRLEEDCKHLQFQLQNSQQQRHEIALQLQQCQEEWQCARLESSNKIDQLHSHIQKMQDLASATALESSAMTEQLRNVQLSSDKQQKDFALMRQERAEMEAELRKKLLEKEEVL
jgi:hypothetical protein